MNRFEIKQSESVTAVQELFPLIQQYPNQALMPSLMELSKRYPYYRGVKGDGNCFYRACMFLHLRSANLFEYEQVFLPHSMDCYEFPFELNVELREKSLHQYWEQSLRPISKLQIRERQVKIVDLLNREPLFDALVVVYLRNLVHEQIRNNWENYKHYFNKTQRVSLREILTFRQDSEEMHMRAVANVLKTKLLIEAVTEDNYTSITIGTGSRTFILSYRPGHYDIPYKDHPSSQQAEQGLAFSREQAWKYLGDAPQKAENLKNFLSSTPEAALRTTTFNYVADASRYMRKLDSKDARERVEAEKKSGRVQYISNMEERPDLNVGLARKVAEGGLLLGLTYGVILVCQTIF